MWLPGSCSVQGAHAVVALHLWPCGIIGASHWITGSTGEGRRDFVGHQGPCGVAVILSGNPVSFCSGGFLVVLKQGIHVWKRCGRCTSCSGSVLCLEAVVLGGGQAERTVASPKLAVLTGAPGHVRRYWVVGVVGTGAVASELGGLAGAPAGETLGDS